MVDLLACTVMPYAWGSRTAIAELTGRPSPSPGPEAELWMGAHPMAPSHVTRDGITHDLAEVIASDPDGSLGAAVASSFGPRLPFLVKVLAAASPLSLQAHPTAAQARAGFAAEDEAGIPRDAANRNYRDASHKPELLCALTPVDALCGFRRAADTLRLFDELGVAELEASLQPLREAPDRDGLARVFRTLMTLPKDDAARLVRATVAGCAKTSDASEFAGSYAWAQKLDALYPDDVGVVSALLLNLLRLAPGEAIFLDAGNLHAYLDGVGVEIMASSDNVLRGGLTKKHVDVAELMRVLDFTDGPVAPLVAQRVHGGTERVYVTTAKEFRLSVVDVERGAPFVRPVHGPEILLCTAGRVDLVPQEGVPVVLTQGRAAFVPDASVRYAVTATFGRSTLYRATVNLT